MNDHAATAGILNAMLISVLLWYGLSVLVWRAVGL